VSGFGARLRSAVAAHGRLCVGIDPHAALLDEWGLAFSAAGVREFGLRVVDAAAGRAAVVKPQVSFFEQHGAAGFAALEEVLAAARAAGLIAIADAKRGDIGTTMAAYATAWLTRGAPLEADALTVSPYLGVGPLRGTFALAREEGKGVFVLAATSNPDAVRLQAALAGHVTVAAAIAHEVASDNAAADDRADEWHDVGLVVGATVDRAAVGLADALLERTPVLAPGFGAQGARLVDIDRLYGAAAPHVLASASRSILAAGPGGLAAAIDAHRGELEDTLG